MWRKGSLTVTREEWFRYGTWCLAADAPPDVDLANSDGYHLYESGLEWELVEMVDGDNVSWQFPEEMSSSEQAEFEQAYAEHGLEGPSLLGWEYEYNNVAIHGELELN